MTPIQFFLSIKEWALATDMPVHDNHQHPDLSRMNLRQLADLPLPRATDARSKGKDEPPAQLQRCA